MHEIAVLTPSYFPETVGGGERAAKWILDHFSILNPIIYTFGEKRREYIHDEVQVRQFKSPPLGNSFARAGVVSWDMLRQIQEHEIIYCHGMSGPHAATAAIASLTGKSRLVYHTHSSFMGSESARHRLVLKPIIRTESQIADRVFCVSSLEQSKLVTKGYVQREKAKTIKNGVTQRETESSIFRRWAEDHLDLAEDYVLSVGDVTPRKGQIPTIQALPHVDEHIEYVLIGTVKDSPQEVAELYGVSDRIHITGPLNHELVRSAMAGSECLVHLSEWESYGLVIAEALAEGTPVVVSDDCGAISEVKQGKNGYISARPHRPEIVAEYIEAAIELSPTSKIRTWEQVSRDIETELIRILCRDE